MTLPESAVAMHRPLCPLCRGDGFVTRGATIARCPACEAREWEAFAKGLQDFPPCFGYACCSGECMDLCPWREGCREGVLH